MLIGSTRSLLRLFRGNDLRRGTPDRHFPSEVVGKPVRVQIPPSAPWQSSKGIWLRAKFPFFVKSARLAKNWLDDQCYLLRTDLNGVAHVAFKAVGLRPPPPAQRLDGDSVAAGRQAFRLGGSWDEGRIRPDLHLIK